jgi:hypothetical protein
MSQGRKGKVNYRCPVCFDREWDIDMLFDNEKKEYYCLRCNYIGSEADVLVRYQHTKTKYKDRLRRYTLAEIQNESTSH